MTYKEIQPYIEKGYVAEQKHKEDVDISIFNYTNTCQFAGAWDEVTTRCRGLIMNTRTGEVLSNPFPKFFNYGEVHHELPNEEPVITEKLDGSLGILYWLHGLPRIATRGSFQSEQADWATEWLYRNLDPQNELPKDKTMLFEIIYPQNRIVVNYDFSGLVHIATRFIETDDEELELDGRFRIPQTIRANDISSLMDMDKENEEGFVIHYPTNKLRIKIKFPEYVRLHRIVTGVSSKSIWECLKNAQPIDEIINNVPDEFYRWVKETKENLEENYNIIEAQCFEDYKGIPNGDRKQQAEYITSCEHPHVLFSMLDDKDYRHIIWKMLKPAFSQPFKEDNQ